MPTYEYQCKKCGAEFERQQKIVDAPVKKCPSCKCNRAKRQISKTSFSLKGGGWYADGYAATKLGNADHESHRKTFEQETGDSAPKRGEK